MNCNFYQALTLFIVVLAMISNAATQPAIGMNYQPQGKVEHVRHFVYHFLFFYKFYANLETLLLMGRRQTIC